MVFKIILNQREVAQPAADLTTYAEFDEDLITILAEACDAIAPIADLTISGFADKPWPASVGMALLVILEQLEGVLEALNSGEDFKIDFFEQTTQRVLRFETEDSMFRIRCESRSDWVPVGDEVIAKQEMKRMLESLYRQFVHFVSDASPATLRKAAFAEWHSRIEALFERMRA